VRALGRGLGDALEAHDPIHAAATVEDPDKLAEADRALRRERGPL